MGLMSDPLGVHRVVRPSGALPQAAEVLDADPDRREPDEIHIAVETLNVDSASFRQLLEAAGGRPSGVEAQVRAIVAERGKLQNPETGSGGMLRGRVAARPPAGASPGSPWATRWRPWSR